MQLTEISLSKLGILPSPPPMYPTALLRVYLFMVLITASFVMPIFGVNQRQIVLNSKQATFLDVEGNPLGIGELKTNQDGDLIQLGYFTLASSSDLFAGDWVPLTEDLYFGDSSTLSGGFPGQFQVSMLFLEGTNAVTVYQDSAGTYQTQSSHVITTSSPKGNPGQLLAIRYYDQNTISEGVRYNTIADTSWKWESLGDQLSFPTIIAIDLQSQNLAFLDPENPFIASIKKNITAENLPVYTVSGSITGAGTVKGYGKYEEGTTAELTATPGEGYEFIGWSGDVAITESPLVTTINVSKTINAEFQIRSFDLSSTITPANSGTIEGIGSYTYGTIAELTAIPATGHQFLYWEVDGSLSRYSTP
jgi:hypothetical protein